MYYPKDNQASFRRDDVEVAVRCAEMPSTSDRQREAFENAVFALVVGFSALAIFWVV